MALAVCLLFDTRSELLVRELWARLERLGVPTLASHTHRQHHPHLSYAVLREWDLPGVEGALGALPDHGPVTLGCHGTVLFPRGRVSLAVAVDADVAARQDAVVRALAATGADLHRNYLPGRWVPHVSVATRAKGPVLRAAVRAVTDSLPLPLVADRAALVDTATGWTRRLPTIP
ncbi:2'-5' RNA ligase family protein [Nocardioides sp. GCM10027113]|uniref:2'-5' RNA ligase family protein n=1 Tax=unclassified Nocardioides TaxID=2615069 RepID=UPI003608A65E